VGELKSQADKHSAPVDDRVADCRNRQKTGQDGKENGIICRKTPPDGGEKRSCQQTFRRLQSAIPSGGPCAVNL